MSLISHYHVIYEWYEANINFQRTVNINMPRFSHVPPDAIGIDQSGYLDEPSYMLLNVIETD